MNTENKCPECGTPLPADAPQGLCPGCLMKAALGSSVDIGPETEGGGQRIGAGFVPPSVEEVAPRFPELEILSLLGRGGMGAVYKARQKQLDRIVALKILPPGLQADPSFADRFVREAQAMAKLHHPHIVTLFEFGQADGLFFFLMEFVDGVNLRELMSNSRISPREALAIVPQICDALQYAHDHGIVHRDIKPENILLNRQGQVKIADFGVARLVGKGADMDIPGAGESVPESATEAGRVIGTPRYMAPEQLTDPVAVDHRADIYALGVVFYQMLTGEIPSGIMEPPSHKVQIDVRLDEVVLRALEKEPGRRYQQATDFKTSVQMISSGSPSPVPESREPAPPSGEAVRPEGETGGVKTFAGKVALVALFFGIVLALHNALDQFAFLAIPALAFLWAWLTSVRSRKSARVAGPVRSGGRRLWQVSGFFAVAGLAMLAAVPRNPVLTFQGIVTDQETGRPVAGASIDLHAYDGASFSPRVVRQTRSGADGEYRMVIPRYADPRYVEQGPLGVLKYLFGSRSPTKLGLLFKTSANGYQPSRRHSGEAFEEERFRYILDYALKPGAETGENRGEYGEPVAGSPSADSAKPDAEFSTGVTAELVGVATHPDPTESWTRNGERLQPIPNDFRDHGTKVFPGRNEIAREFYVRFDYSMLPHRDVSVRYRVPGSGVTGSGTNENRSSGKVRLDVVAALPARMERASLSLGVAAGSWKTIATTDGKSSSTLNQNSAAPGNSVVFSRVTFDNNTPVLTVTHNYGHMDYKLVLSVEGGPPEFGGNEIDTSHGNGYIQSTYTFPTGGKPIANFRFEVREFEWQEIDDIALHPTAEALSRTPDRSPAAGGLDPQARIPSETTTALKAISAAPSSVAPVLEPNRLSWNMETERILPIPWPGSEAGGKIDLDTGLLVDPPASRLWETSSGVDVYTHPAIVPGIAVTSGTSITGIPLSRWDTITSEEIRRLLVLFPPGGANVVGVGRHPSANDLQAYALRTAEGNLVVLQIVGMVDNDMGIKIRYKLVKDEQTTQAAPHVTTADESTTLTLRLNSNQSNSSKQVTVKVGQNAMNIMRRSHPAEAAADDDPWIAYPATDGGNYRLFFLPADCEEPDPTVDPLYAVIHYESHESDTGVFLLPKALSGRRCGDFRILRVALDSGTTRTAVVAHGMPPDAALSFFAPAVDHAPEDDVILFDAANGGQYRLSFSPTITSDTLRGESGGLGLERVEIVSRPGTTTEPQILLSAVQADEGVPGPVRRAEAPRQSADAGGITFNVRSQDGQSVSAFRVIAGSRPGLSDSSDVIANWQPHTLQTGKNGVLNWDVRRTWDETIFRIEADGYQPTVTSWIVKSNMPERLSITLAADPGITGRVLTPDGSPASSATLALAMVQRDARLSGGQLVTSDPSSTRPTDLWRRPILVETDPDGRYRVPQMKDSSAAVLIVHGSGVRELSFSEFERAREITLQGWGNVEGRVQWKDTPGSSEPVELSVTREIFGYPGVIGQYETTVTDSAGRFSFDKVIPGRVQIAQPYPMSTKDGTSYAILPGMVMHVDVAPGEPTPVLLGGRGRAVKGRLTGCPSSCEGIPVGIAFDAPHFGSPGDEVQWDARAQFRNSPIGDIFDPSTSAKVDGSFALPKVLPGDYQLLVGGSMSGRRITVPLEQLGVPATDLDLGDIPAGH